MSAVEAANAPVSLAGETAGQAAGGVASSADAVASSAGGAANAMNGAVSTLGQPDALISWGSYFQALAVLFLIVAVLFAALWFLRRQGAIKLLTRQGDLALESRLALGPKKSIIVVRFLNKRVLLGVTDQQITMLTELPTDEDDTALPDADPEIAPDFNAHFARASGSDPENPA